MATTGRNIIGSSQALSLPTSPPSVLDSMTATLPPVPEINPLDFGGPLSPPPPVQLPPPAPAPQQGLLARADETLEGLLGREKLLGMGGQAPSPAPPPLRPAPYDPYPSVQNEDGTVSNVRLSSVNLDGVERVIPTMWHGEQRGIDEAIENAKRVGPNRFPSFSTTEEAEQWIAQNHGKAAGLLPEPSDVHPDTKSVQDAWSGVDEATKQMLRPMTAAEVAVATNRGAILRADDGDPSAPTEEPPEDSWAKMLMETSDEVLEQMFKTPDMAAAMRRIEEEVKGGDLTSWGRTWGGWFPYEAIAAGVPWLAGGAAATKSGFIAKAGLDIMNGAGDEEDYDIFARFVRVGQLQENRSWLENSAELMSTIPGMGVEFTVAFLGAGTVAAPIATGASIAGRAGLKLLKRSARKKLLKAFRKATASGAAMKNVAGISQATRIPGVGRRLAAQTGGKLGAAVGRSGLMVVTNPAMTARMVMGELQDDYTFDKDEAGKLAVMHADPDDPDTFMENVTKGVIKSMVANFSEQLGGIAMPALKRGAWSILSKSPTAMKLGGITSAPAQRAFKAGVMRKFFELNPTSAGRARYSKLMAMAGIHGPLEEILEEYADMAINAGLGIEEFQNFTWTQIMEMGLAFSVIPMGKKILTKGGSKILGEISAPSGTATWDEIKKQDEEYNAFAAPLRQEDVEALEKGELSEEEVVIKEHLRRNQWLAEMEDEITEITGEDGVVFHIQADGSWTDTKEATEATEKFDSLHDLAAREVEQQDVQEGEQEAPAATTESLLTEIKEEEAARDQLEEEAADLRRERQAAIDDTTGTFDTTRLDEEIENLGLQINAANEKLESLNTQLSAAEAGAEVAEEDQKPEPPPEVVVTTERTKGKPTRITVTVGDSLAQVQRIDGKWYRVDAEGNIVNAETGVREEAAQESEALTDLRGQRAELQLQLEDIESDPKARETPFEGRSHQEGLHIESLVNDIAAVDKLIEAEMRPDPLGATRDEAVSRLGDILSPGRRQQAPTPKPAPTPRSAGHQRIDSLISVLEQQDRADSKVRLEAARRIKARIQGVPDITAAQVDQLLKNEAQIVVVDQLLEKGVSEEQAQKHRATRDRLVLSNKQIIGTAGKAGKEGVIGTELTRDRFSKNEVNMVRRMFRGAEVKVVPGSNGSELEVEVAGKKVRIARVREPLTKRTFGSFTPEDSPEFMGAGVYLGQEDLVGAKLSVGGKEIDAESIILLTGVSDLTTIPHEVFHLAMDLVLTKSEQDYLFRKYAPGESRDPQTGRYSRDAEETVAKAYQAYGLSQAKNPIFRKFADFWRNLADRLFLNFDSREARRIFRDLPRLIETAREPGEGGAEGVKLQTISKKQRQAYITHHTALVERILDSRPGKIKIPKIPEVRSEVQKTNKTVVVFEAAKWLQGEIRKGMTGFNPLLVPGKGVSDLSENEIELLAEMMAADAIIAMRKDKGKKSRDRAIGWYGKIVTEALNELGGIFPELHSEYAEDGGTLPNGKTTGEARLVFKLMLAITSDGEKVEANFRNASKAYAIWRETGEVQGMFKRGDLGKKMAVVTGLIDTHGWKDVDNFLARKFKAKYVKNELGYKVTGELAETEIPAASIVGPKLGSFFNNLNQRFETLTMDLWWSRTVGRYRGNILSRNIPLARSRIIKSTDQLPSFVKTIKDAEELVKPEGVTNSQRYLKDVEIETDEAAIDKMTDEAFLSSGIVRYAVALNARNGSIFTETATSNIEKKELQDGGINGRTIEGEVSTANLGEGRTAYDSLMNWAETRTEKWLAESQYSERSNPREDLKADILKVSIWKQQQREAVTTPEFKAAGRVFNNLFGVYATPKNGNDRVQQRAITAKAIEIFSDTHGPITVADFQALLWYHEKQLWTNLGVRGTGITTSTDTKGKQEQDLDYGTAAKKIHKEFQDKILDLAGQQEDGSIVPPGAGPRGAGAGVSGQLAEGDELDGRTEEGDGQVGSRGEEEGVTRAFNKATEDFIASMEEVENDAYTEEVRRRNQAITKKGKKGAGYKNRIASPPKTLPRLVYEAALGNDTGKMRSRLNELQKERRTKADEIGLPSAERREQTEKQAAVRESSLESLLAAIKDNPGGFTVDLTGVVPDGGFVVAPDKRTERVVSADQLDEQAVEDYIDEFYEVFSLPGAHLGGWFDEETGEYKLDAVFPLPLGTTADDYSVKTEDAVKAREEKQKEAREEAIRIGIWGDQDAIFLLYPSGVKIDGELGELIPLKDDDNGKPTVPEGFPETVEEVLERKPSDPSDHAAYASTVWGRQKSVGKKGGKKSEAVPDGAKPEGEEGVEDEATRFQEASFDDKTKLWSDGGFTSIGRKTNKQHLLDEESRIPSEKELKDTLRGEKRKRNVRKNRSKKIWKHGAIVALRIDIPFFMDTAKEGNPQYAVTVRMAGQDPSFDSIAKLKGPVAFGLTGGVEKNASDILFRGKEKGPFAVVSGALDQVGVEKKDSERIPKGIDDWIPVGFNPHKATFFYNKRTGREILRGTHAISIGNTVYTRPMTEGQQKEHGDQYGLRLAPATMEERQQAVKDNKIKPLSKTAVERIGKEREAKADPRFQPVPEAVNRRYMELARDPKANRVELQKMVDLAAKSAGYDVGPAFHAGPVGINIFDESKTAPVDDPSDLLGTTGAFFFADREKSAANYAKWMYGVKGKPYKPVVTKAYLKMEKTKKYADFWNSGFAMGKFGKNYYDDLQSQGYDSIEVGYDAWMDDTSATGKASVGKQFVVLRTPENIKSAEPVTRDDAGNVIPLSERFDPSTEDTRFQQITPAQWRKVMERRAKRRDRGEHRAEDSDLAQALFTPESVESLRAVDEIRGSAGYQGREVKEEDQEVRERAEKFLEDAKTDETKQARVDELIKKIKRGEDLEPWETWAARKLLEAQSWNAIIEHQKFGRDTESEKAVEEALLMWSGYRDTGTQWSQTGRMRQDQEKSPSIANRKAALDALLAFTVPEKNKLRKLRKILRANADGSVAYEHAKKRIDEVLESAKKRVLGLKKKLKAAGVNLASPKNNWKDPRFVANVINQIGIADSTYFDKQFEFFRSGLMSGTGTVLRNIVGNTLNATWELTAQRFTSAFLNTVTPGSRAGGATFGEFKHIIKGLIQSMPEAGRNWTESWVTERVVFSDELGSATDRFGSARLELTGKGRRGPKIAGKKGRAWRWSQRMALSMDQFFQTAIATQHAQVMAHRIALREKKRGQAMTDRMVELTSDKQSEAWVAAYDEALRLTYQEKLDPVGEFLLKGRGLLPGIRYKLPFFTTPWNIARVAGKKTPIGSLRLAWKLGRLGRAKLGWDATYDYHTMNNLGSVSTRQAVIEDVAEQLIAWTIFMSMVAYAEGPDEEDGLPNITGSAEKHSSKRGEQYRVAAPYTIRVPFSNERISYQGFSPLDISLATMVDAIDAVKEAKNDKATMAALADGLKSAVNLFSDQSSMRGFKDIITLLTEPTESGVMRFLTDTGVAFVPNIVRQASRETDPYYREYKVGGEIGSGEWWTSGMAMLGKKAIPLAQLAPSPKVELWGSDVKRGRWFGFGPVSDWLLKMSFMSMTRIYNFEPGAAHKLNTMIRIWNVQNPNDGYYPTQPKKNWKRDGESYVMSDPEYHRFMKMAGEYALERASDYGFDYANPTERDIERIKKFVNRGRKRAKDALLRERRDREDEPVDRAG